MFLEQIENTEGKFINWAGSYEYTSSKLYYPKNVEEVQILVKNLDKLKVLGTMHCCHGIADSEENLVSLKYLDKVINLDKDTLTVTIETGIIYGHLAIYLYKNGFALHNMASLPHISVAGACATGTHGSGTKNGNLSSAVRAMEIVTATGDIITISRDKNYEEFYGMVVHLGGIGVVTKLVLDVQPVYMMKQMVYENLRFDQLKDHFIDIMSSGYSVSLYTKWQDKMLDQVWVKRRVEHGKENDYEKELFGAKQAKENLVFGMDAGNTTDQCGIVGPWHERLPHFKLDHTPTGNGLESEYFVDLDKAYEAMLAVDEITPHLWESEIRTIAADDFWMSPFYKRPSVAIHFLWKQDFDAARKLMLKIEEKLEPFKAIPHWGKLFMVEPGKFKEFYPKLPDFVNLCKKYDPNRKFRNKFLDNFVFNNA
uniref:FAD-binding PCMH-type domain-containing protein n=1 Tax=Acrobeloides nanus TaxID=290746 RepID=A0A914DIE8_9BILA